MFKLKDYQVAVLDELTAYMQTAHALQDPDTGFYKQTKRSYQKVPGMTGVPYVCLRVPTGGGKTLLAAHAISAITSEWLKTQHSLCLWLVPSNAIREQTLNALRDKDHPYRQALDSHFNDKVEVMDIDEALSVTRSTLDGATCIIVSTLAALRRDDTSGLRVYRENGSLMSHFSGLTPAQEKLLDKSPDVSRLSLANVLRLRRPITIVDEAHNARTSLSFDTLCRFSPSAVLELTATPQQNTQDENRGSNVLTHVSALELKREGMLKLPVKLQNIPEEARALAKSVSIQQELENVALKEEQTTGQYIRPIVLIQAQNKRKGQETLTPEVVKEMLVSECKIPEDQIAIATGSTRELEGVDINSKDCRIRYVITVQALVEGWDCPFAYVLCSLAESYSSRAVEQILGRVLRMPYAKRRAHEALNCAYAVTATDSFSTAATGICDSLIENGFEKFEAQQLVTQAQAQGMFDEVKFEVSAAPDLSELPQEYQDRVAFNEVDSTVVVGGIVNRRFQQAVESVLATEEDRGKFQTSLVKPKKHWAKAESPADRGEDFVVPMLAIRQGDFIEALGETHFTDFDWTLKGVDTELSEQEYSAAGLADYGALLDMSDTGHVTISPTDRLARDLAPWQGDTGWERKQLVSWLCSSVPHHEQTHMVMAGFVDSLVQGLIAKEGFEFDMLVRDRYRLRDVCSRKYNKVRLAAMNSHGTALMFGANSALEVSPKVVFEFSADSYAPDQAYLGPYRINKHFYQTIGDMNSEETDCATLLAGLDCVKYWVRN
ncbi:MAG: DEAD/DEAH box helicase family protein, partial [Planctomycetes bacterium]|nr:DEAD/DEAH box helicase family protein [Planctomycetota bacterium]